MVLSLLSCARSARCLQLQCYRAARLLSALRFNNKAWVPKQLQWRAPRKPSGLLDLLPMIFSHTSHFDARSMIGSSNPRKPSGLLDLLPMIFFSYLTFRCAFHDWLLESRARLLIGLNSSCCCRLITYWPARSMLTHFRRRAEIRDAHRPSKLLLLVKVIFLASSKRGENQFFGNNFKNKVFPEGLLGSQGAM